MELDVPDKERERDRGVSKSTWVTDRRVCVCLMCRVGIIAKKKKKKEKNNNMKQKIKGKRRRVRRGREIK